MSGLFPAVKGCCGWKIYCYATGFIIKRPYRLIDYFLQIALIILLAFNFFDGNEITMLDMALLVTISLGAFLVLDRFIVAVCVYVNIKKKIIMSGDTYERHPLHSFSNWNLRILDEKCSTERLVVNWPSNQQDKGANYTGPDNTKTLWIGPECAQVLALIKRT